MAFGLTLHALLVAAGIDPVEVRAYRHTPTEVDGLFEAQAVDLALCRPDLIAHYQAVQGAAKMSAMRKGRFVAAFMRRPSRPNAINPAVFLGCSSWPRSRRWLTATTSPIR